MVDGRPEGADAFSLAIAASRAIAASTGLDEMLSAVARRADPAAAAHREHRRPVSRAAASRTTS